MAAKKKTTARKTASPTKDDKKSKVRSWSVHYYTPVDELRTVATDYVAVASPDDNTVKPAPPGFLAKRSKSNLQMDRMRTLHGEAPSASEVSKELGIVILTKPMRLVAAKAYEELDLSDTELYIDAGLDPETATPQEYADVTGEWPALSGEVKIDVVSVVVTAASLKKEADKLLSEGYGFIAIEPEHGDTTTKRVNDMAADLRKELQDLWGSQKKKQSNDTKIAQAKMTIFGWGDTIPLV